MDWVNIITALVSLISGGALSSIATIGITKQKTKAEIEKVRTDNSNASITALNATIEGLNKQLDAEQADTAILREKIDKLQELCSNLRNECTTKGFYMCVHQGCCVRRPSNGRGKEWYEKHKEDDDFGADYIPIEEIVEAYKSGKKLYYDEIDNKIEENE